MIQFKKLLKEVKAKGITDNSREVKPGYIFVAIKGEHVDANEFVDNAVQAGAVAIVSEKKQKHYNGVKCLKVENARKALALLASEFYGNPSRKLKVIGVTGSDGKTTTSHMLYEMLLADHKRVGLISTISAKIGKRDVDTGFHVTNPEPIPLQKILNEMVKAGLKYVVMETTSHGIAQERIAGIEYDVAVLTNITHEHIDYHRTFKAYRDTKLKLFLNSRVSVLNRDDKNFSYFRKKIKNPKITYSTKKDADYVASNIEISDTMQFDVSDEYGVHTMKLGLLGEYNVQNALAAIATARYFEVNWDKIGKALCSMKNPTGRLDKIANNRGVNVYIDFAHTPNALENLLNLMRTLHDGKLIAVFGAAGERDVEKRSMMAEISTRLADVSVFTAEDPRSEDINKIISQMVRGAHKKSKFYKIPERGEAISYAINKLANKGDTVVICGKAHEKSMAYNGIEYPWSDYGAVKMALNGKALEINRL